MHFTYMHTERPQQQQQLQRKKKPSTKDSLSFIHPIHALFGSHFHIIRMLIHIIIMEIT